MTRYSLAAALLLCPYAMCLAQQPSQPFAAVDAALKRGRLHWTEASQPFQTAREQLGPDFESELWKYLGDDVDKQDRVANFLVYSGYLHGRLPMPNLARLIEIKTLFLLSGKTDTSSRIRFVTASVNAAVESAELEYQAEAEQHKSDVQKMLAADRSLVAGLPAMTDYENCIYDLIGNRKIPSPANTCSPNRTADDPRPATIDMGYFKADEFISRPEPRWPKSDGHEQLSDVEIRVRVLVDETGRVQSAEAFGGSSAYQEAGISAAHKARFQRVIYQGGPVKAYGWLAYAY